MKTGKIFSVAAILSTMVAADVQAAHGGGGFHGGGGGFHGGGMAFHGGGFARSAPAFRGGFARPTAFRSGGFVRPAGTFARPVAFRRPVINQRFVNQRFVNERFVRHDHFDHHHNRNIVVIAGVPYAYPYYSDYYYPADYYSDYYPSDYYSDYYTAPSSTYATTYVAPTSYTYAVGGTSSVIVLQRRLAREGYYHGAIDGIMGPGTRAALLKSERAHGQRPSSAIHRSHSSSHKAAHKVSHKVH